MAKIMVAPYFAGMVNHGMMDEMARVTHTIFVWHMLQCTLSTIQSNTDSGLDHT